MRSMKDEQATSTPAERVRASEARKLQAGGRRMPGGVMPAEVVEALDRLLSADYAPSASACIFRALTEAAMRLPKPKP